MFILADSFLLHGDKIVKYSLMHKLQTIISVNNDPTYFETRAELLLFKILDFTQN